MIASCGPHRYGVGQRIVDGVVRPTRRHNSQRGSDHRSRRSDLLPAVFEPFTQAQHNLARSQGGLGLELLPSCRASLKLANDTTFYKWREVRRQGRARMIAPAVRTWAGPPRSYREKPLAYWFFR
jgi:hypothetical protein